MYDIPASNTTTRAGRPYHLEKRLESRDRSRENSINHHQNVSEKRESIIQERKQRISQRLERIHKNVQEQRKQTESSRDSAEKSMSENMLNAEKKRHMILQDKEAKFAEKVERAKTVSRRTSQAKSKTAEQKRQKLQARLINGNLRRLMLLKIPRSKLSDENAVEAEIARYRTATKTIQHWWRMSMLKRNIAQFERTGLHGQELRQAPFDRIAPMLQDKRIIALASRLLLQVKKMTAAGRARRYKNPTRVFLSAILIVHHTKEIMPDVTEAEEAVKKAAVAMLSAFDKLMAGDEAIVPEFIELWHCYHTMFEEWKAADTEKILNYMFDHFMQLEGLRESVTSEPGANAEWHPQIDSQQALIKDKVMRLGGKSALNRFLAGQKQFRDMSDSSDSEIMQDRRRRHDSVMNSRYVANGESSAAPVVEKEVALNDVMQEFGGMMTNERLAHELIMNPEFELTVDPQSLEAQIRNVAKKAFFDRIRADMEVADFSWVTGVIDDIRMQLNEMLPENSKLKKEIADVLDSQLIQQQVDRKVFDFGPYIAFVTAKMLQLCAPIRDASIREIATQDDVIVQIETMLTILDQMKMDLANFKLRSLRPVLMGQAVEYERSKFQHALKNKMVTLEMTEKWLSEAVKKVEDKVASRNPEHVEHPENSVRYDQVYFDALISLLFTPDSNESTVLAETLSMDAERIMMFQNEVKAISVVASLLMLTKNFVAELRDEVAEIAKLKKNLFLLLQEPNTTAQHLALHIISSMQEILMRRERSLTPEQETMITTMVEKILTFKDTVYTLLNRRISQRIRSHLTNGRRRNDSNNGLETVQSEVDDISNKVFLFAKHNREVFAPWYDEIISQFA